MTSPKLQRAVVRPIPRTVLRWAAGVGIAGVLVTKLFVVPWLKVEYGESLVDIGRKVVREFGAAIPQWQAAHPGRTCPGALGELTQYTRYQDTHDPWGGTLGMLCTKDGIVVYSLGEDGQLGTPDDLWSAQ